MGPYANAAPNTDGVQNNWGSNGCSGRARWHPIEIFAMVAGFILFWPIGLAILAYKIWQKKSGRTSGFMDQNFEHARENMMRHWSSKMSKCGARRGEWNAGFGMRSTGNVAFDDWRSAELARIEEERQKLVAAEREFEAYMENLRRAKDREEFDRFMNDRNAARDTKPTAQ